MIISDPRTDYRTEITNIHDLVNLLWELRDGEDRVIVIREHEDTADLVVEMALSRGAINSLERNRS